MPAFYKSFITEEMIGGNGLDMKEKYVAPEMITIVFSRKDIITASNETPFVPFSETWSEEAN